ncbi:CRIB domain-containing protein RIC10 isoform X1 [Beta vulgaris subsp. vulgaris]|uniref:CRIB domain-containing protein RIC10 isoform X1 n=1 Tax=Beta vulgaris subsp. vulgaris TaxID=3555 RepID=UPI0020367361|nr:CRIB domain-containing protein RIC10 isoform X1 [Beta vulgaris subsp. vulgaris]
MTTKIRGMCKGSFKYISQIFVVKERELEIGNPTDVKHVAHIGWDGPDGTTPSWMSEFGTGSELNMGSVGSVGGSRDQTWTSQDVTDFERSFGRQTSTAKLSNFPPTNIPTNPKKPRRKKTKSSNSSPKSGSTRSSSRSSKSRSVLGESEAGDSRRSSVNL